MKRNENFSMILVILLLLLSIGSSGCLLQNRSGQSPTNIPITTAVNNSTVPTLTIQTHIPTTSIPSIQSGVRIFKDADSICIGQTLTFGLINEGNSSIFFNVGDPYIIQINNNGTWGNIFNGGGFQGSWHLHPGDKIEKKWTFADGKGEFDLYEWFNESGSPKGFIISPGLYRIEFGGTSEDTNEPFNIATEFTIRECRSGIPI